MADPKKCSTCLITEWRSPPRFLASIYTKDLWQNQPPRPPDIDATTYAQQLADNAKRVAANKPTGSPLLRGLRLLYGALSCLSLWSWISWLAVPVFESFQRVQAPKNRRSHRRACYQVGDLWVVSTTAIIVYLSIRLVHYPAENWIKWILLYRLAEIALTVFRIVLLDTFDGGYPHTPVSAVRYLIFIPLYLVQTAYAFAAIYSTVPGAIFANLTSPLHLTDYLYISATTLTTMGSVPALDHRVQIWQMVESVFGLLLLGVGLAIIFTTVRLTVDDE